MIRRKSTFDERLSDTDSFTKDYELPEQIIVIEKEIKDQFDDSPEKLA